jgi:hypothetical protein
MLSPYKLKHRSHFNWYGTPAAFAGSQCVRLLASPRASALLKGGISGEEMMTRLTAKDFPQELLEYYDYYAHGKISKREFLQLAGKYAVGGMTALALFNLLKPNYALAGQVSFTDPDIHAEYIRYPSPEGHGEVRVIWWCRRNPA